MTNQLSSNFFTGAMTRIWFDQQADVLWVWGRQIRQLSFIKTSASVKCEVKLVASLRWLYIDIVI